MPWLATVLLLLVSGDQDVTVQLLSGPAQTGTLVALNSQQVVIESDGELAEEDFHLDLATELRFAGPWGQHFPEPVFDGRFNIVHQRLVGEKHLKLVLSLPGSERLVDAIAFNVDLDTWPDESIDQVELAYRLDVNEFRGKRSVQLMVEHLRPMSSSS